MTLERALHYRARTGLSRFAFTTALFILTAVFIPTGAVAVLAYAGTELWLACALALGVACIMAVLLFFWLRLWVITPLQKVSGSAQMLIDNAGQPNFVSTPSEVLVQDLTATLARLQERLQRLVERDDAEAQIGEQVGRLKAAFTLAAGGNLTQRAEVLPGPYQELALAANHMLDALAQRWLLQNRLAERVRLASERLHSLATELRGSSTKPASESVLGPLPEMLQVGIERLTVSTDALGRALEPILLNKPASGKKERFNRAFSSTSTGLTFLAQRSTDLARSGKRIADAHKQAETLATNLLLLADDKQHPQLRRIADHARVLERDLAESETHLARGIEYLLSSREQLATSLQELIALYGDVSERLQTWETLCDQLQNARAELRQQVDLTRPVGASISNHLQQLSSELESIRKENSARQQKLQELCAQTEQLAQISSEFLVLLEGTDFSSTSQPRLAPQKNDKSLSPAIQATQELIQRAQAEGIIPLDRSPSGFSELGNEYEIEVSEPEENLALDGKPVPEARR